MSTAIYPGTFDPFTLGHLDILKRASKVFSNVIVAVSENPGKCPLFTLEQRVQMVYEAISELHNVTVKPFTGMLIDFIRESNADILIRGIRNIIDCEYELSLTTMYKQMAPGIEIIMLAASPKTTFISSTFVRDIIIHHGDASLFVPPVVLKKINDIYKI